VASAANFPASLLPVGVIATTSRRIATRSLRRKMARSPSRAGAGVHVFSSQEGEETIPRGGIFFSISRPGADPRSRRARFRREPGTTRRQRHRVHKFRNLGRRQNAGIKEVAPKLAHETGYVEGQNVAIEYRWACGPLSARLDLKAPAVPRSDTEPDHLSHRQHDNVALSTWGSFVTVSRAMERSPAPAGRARECVCFAPIRRVERRRLQCTRRCQPSSAAS
jgi:hypothetical protein